MATVVWATPEFWVFQVFLWYVQSNPMSHQSEIFHSLIFKFKENWDNKYKWILFKSATLSWALKIPHNLHRYCNM